MTIAPVVPGRQLWAPSAFRIVGRSQHERYEGTVTALDAIDAANAFRAAYPAAKTLVITMIEAPPDA